MPRHGLIVTTAQLDAEALYSAYEYLSANDEHWQAALDAQRSLAGTGRHCAVGTADLLIATLGNAHDVTLLHYDVDFEIVAEVLPFEHRWALERGTIS
ncbi:MAG: hypothetical protein PGN37_06525 [Mycobacterium kyogaense]|uniref:hypothetical protein n=1 Tax=Mycobacterium kyogaense TaxID=2212479 RepID=UPI002FFCC7B3